MTFGLSVALIGMGTVFVALIFLVGFINLMSWATGLSKRAKTSQGEASPGGIVAVPTPVAAVDYGEVHAVIAAAVAAYTRKP